MTKFVHCCSLFLLVMETVSMEDHHHHGDTQNELNVNTVTMVFTYATVTKTTKKIKGEGGKLHSWTAGNKRKCEVTLTQEDLEEIIERYQKKKLEYKDIVFIDIIGSWGNASLHLDDFTAVDPGTGHTLLFLSINL